MKAKKKLFIPIAMLVLAVMAMTSTTFAWFTSNSRVNGTINSASVTSAQAMLYVVNNAGLPNAFSSTGAHSDAELKTQGNWSTTGATNSLAIGGGSALRMKDLTYVHPSEIDPSVSADPGTIIEVDGTNITTGAAGLYKQGIYSALTDADIVDVTADSIADYIDLTYTFWVVDDNNIYNLNVDLSAASYIRTTARTTPVDGNVDKVISFNDLDKEYFKTIGTSLKDVASFYGDTIGTGDPNDPDDDIITCSEDGLVYQFDSAGTYVTNAANASRVMFSRVAQTGAANTLGTPTPIAVWEPNAGAGYGNAYTTIDIQDMYVKAQLGNLTAPAARNARYSNAITAGGGAGGLDGYTAAINGDVPLLNLGITTDINTGTQVNLATFASGTKDFSDGVNNYFRHQINVKIWLEGWDSDCFNVILGDAIDTNFSFNTTIV